MDSIIKCTLINIPNFAFQDFMTTFSPHFKEQFHLYCLTRKAFYVKTNQFYLLINFFYRRMFPDGN